jgi:hypothetical protein
VRWERRVENRDGGREEEGMFKSENKKGIKIIIKKSE